MLESLVARARFYDITGYWIPGNVTIIIGWLYAWAFGWREQANRVLAYASDNLVVFGILIVIVGGYAIGHLVNSVSKLLLEKLVLAGSFKRNRDWLSRLQSDSSFKKDEVMRRFNQEFHYQPTSSASAGGVIQGWAEQQLPAPSMTTFRFLCFYGMIGGRKYPLYSYALRVRPSLNSRSLRIFLEALSASSNSEDILHNAKVYASTKEAIADLQYVLATTARHRDQTKMVYNADAGAMEISAAAAMGELGLQTNATVRQPSSLA